MKKKIAFVLFGALFLCAFYLSVAFAGDNTPVPPAGFEDEVITAPDGNPFSDTDPNSLEGKAAKYLYYTGVIGGFPDGEFKGEQYVNRAELAKFLLLARYGDIDESVSNSDITFSDVLFGEWYVPFVVRAAEEGIINGYPDGTFKPEKNVNTAEFLKMFLKTFDLEMNLSFSYVDVQPDSWYLPYAGIAEKYDLFPYRDSFLEPTKELTRNEVAVAFYVYLEVGEEVDDKFNNISDVLYEKGEGFAGYYAGDIEKLAASPYEYYSALDGIFLEGYSNSMWRKNESRGVNDVMGVSISEFGNVKDAKEMIFAKYVTYREGEFVNFKGYNYGDEFYCYVSERQHLDSVLPDEESGYYVQPFDCTFRDENVLFAVDSGLALDNDEVLTENEAHERVLDFLDLVFVHFENRLKLVMMAKDETGSGSEDETGLTEEPVVEEPVAEEPVAEEPAEEPTPGPVVEEPVVEEPVAEEPVEGAVSVFITDAEISEFVGDTERDYVYAIAKNLNSFYVLDDETFEIKKEIAVGSKPVSMAISIDNSKAYIATSGQSAISVINLNTLEKEPDIKLSIRPYDLEVSSDYLYITHADDQWGNGVVVDLDTYKEVSELGTYQYPNGDFSLYEDAILKISPDENYLYIATKNLSPANIYKLDISNSVPKIVSATEHGSIGSNLQNMVLNKGGDKLFVACGSPYSIQILSTSDLEFAGVVDMEPYPSDVSIYEKGGLLLASTTGNTDRLYIFDLNNYTLIESVPLNGFNIVSLFVSEEKDLIFILTNADGVPDLQAITIIDLSTIENK